MKKFLLCLPLVFGALCAMGASSTIHDLPNRATNATTSYMIWDDSTANYNQTFGQLRLTLSTNRTFYDGLTVAGDGATDGSVKLWNAAGTFGVTFGIDAGLGADTNLSFPSILHSAVENNVFTNITINILYSSNAFFTNVFITTNYSEYSFVTNQFVTTNYIDYDYVTNLIVKNLRTDVAYISNTYVTNITVTGSQTNAYLEPNMFVFTDANKKLVSTLDGSTLTNLPISAQVWTNDTGSLYPSGTNETVSGSLFLGSGSGYEAINAADSQFVGDMAGYGATNASSSQFVGFQAGMYASEASSSEFIGKNAGYNATNAYSSFFIGYESGKWASEALRSYFIGEQGGYQATNAHNSQFIGEKAGYLASEAEYSVFIGDQAGAEATSASESVFIGDEAGLYASGADTSSFLGSYAGYEAVSADSSVFVGGYSGYRATNASKSIFIGYNSGTNRANTLWIDTQAPSANGSYQPLIYGEFDNRKLLINGTLEVTNLLSAKTFQVLTNVWSGPTNSVNMTNQWQKYATYTPCSITGLVNQSVGGKVVNNVLVTITNAASTNITLYYEAAIRTGDGARSWVITNACEGKLSLEYDPNGSTNGVFRMFY